LPNITVENTETRALITFYYLKDAAMNAQSLASWLPGWRLASLLLQNSTRFPLSRLVSSFTAPTTPAVSGGNQENRDEQQHQETSNIIKLNRRLSNT
jgi:hypothetical protein